MDQPTVLSFPSLRGLLECRAFNADIETVHSKLGSWLHKQMDRQRTGCGWIVDKGVYTYTGGQM